jgi:rubrerythrin
VPGPRIFEREKLMKKALYEAVLRDVGRYEELARRAESLADDELAGFFREIRDENRRRADQARRLLAQRIAE